jgi:membrane protein|nr:MAG TPA: hypothetical protein [Caudoviricetes sp.]
MSKRYPPIYSVIAIIALVTVAATNTNGAALYVANTIVKTLDALTNNIANYLGFVLTNGFAIVTSFADKYAVFCLHVIIVAIYCKMLFGKRAKEVHNTIKQTLNDYENGRCSQSEADLTLYFWTMWFYMATACVLGLTIANIIIPNFWHISMTQLLEIVSNNLLTDGYDDTLNTPSTITMWIFGTLSTGAISAMIHVWVKLHNIKKQKQKETA